MLTMTTIFFLSSMWLRFASLFFYSRDYIFEILIQWSNTKVLVRLDSQYIYVYFYLVHDNVNDRL